MNSLGTIRQRSVERLRLVETLTITDELGTWSYDHFRGLFDIELRSHLQKSFPSCWVLANDARIHCQFAFSGTRQASEIATSLIFERPRTSSLEQFVEDVYAKEDNMKAKQWLEALHAEDILSFPHLSNLKQTEWDNIKKLSMNAKRILKTAVDRERESAADDRRRSFEESSSNEEAPRLTGTGKSEIMSKLSTKLGIAMVGPPLAAGELNRPLVGESERVIIALASRCHRVPYAMCCLSIDEIDSLAPKRDEDSSEGKVDKISVLLSLIDGIKDVPNLMIFCATNRLHMMDEAFLRRMSGKFFVGRPSSQARTKILAQIPEWALEPDLIDRLTIVSTNFSGAACKAFTRAITVRCMAAQRTQPNFHVNYKEALKIADRTAQQYQIFLGSENLPRLLLRNLMNGSRIRVNHLSRHIYAGRIIVDLHGGSARIEIIESGGRIAVIEHKLLPNETSVQSLLERLTVYGKDRNVQLLQLIDLNLLASQGAYDEKKVFETLKERYDECVAYTRSMIIYDLDSLVGVNKSESDSSMGRSMSSSVVNQSVYTYVRARFREAVVEQQQEKNDEQQQMVEKWAVAVIREPFLLRQFSSDVQFARTRQEEEELELEQHKAEDLLKCVKCKDLYIENENKMGNCVHHDGFIYDNSAPDLAIHTQSEVAYMLTKLECDAINYPERREEFERQKNKFKWICCDTTVTTGSGAGGCKKGKHGFGEEVREGQRRDGHRLDQTVGRRVST
ncbi:unnamed protein product [Rotaria sp. Silwood1]|nr:unnamed protein product [Rotaria sp. Silwood1]CAF4879013.1 unnamed protein product [Rotaria sp. Silwood1]